MENNILTLKIALMQNLDEFLKLNKLSNRFILDRYLLWGGDQSEFDRKPFSVSFDTIGWEKNPPLGYIIELLDLGSVTLPMVKHFALSVEDGCFTEIKLQLCLNSCLDEVKTVAKMISTSFQQADYRFMDGQIDMTEDSFSAVRPGGSLTYTEWKIAGKEDKYRYILKIREDDSLSTPKKYCLIVKAQVITETMEKLLNHEKLID